MDTQNRIEKEIEGKSSLKKILKVLGLILGIIILILIILIISVAAYTKVAKQNTSNANSTSTNANTKTINGETNSKYSDAFMENFKSVYIKGCIGDNPKKDAFCECSYTSLIGKFGFEGFMQKTLEYKKTKQMDPEFLGAVSGCVSLMPTKQQ